MHGRKAVKAYVESLGHEAREWLLALYVDGHLQLLSVDTVARGDVGGCPIPFWKIIERAHAIKAQGFVLVHNHPSGDPKASTADIQVTRRLAHVSHELNVPLLDHLIVAGNELYEVAEWHWDGHPYGRQRR
ncbi:MAG: JAB domain-containing protein [Sphingomicrobium sp.]